MSAVGNNTTAENNKSKTSKSHRMTCHPTSLLHLYSQFSIVHRGVTTTRETSLTQSQGSTTPVDSWLDRTHRIEMRFDKLTHGNVFQFVDLICTTFIADRNKDSIHEQVILLSRLQKGIYKCHNEILQAAGVGSEFSEVERVRKKICTTVSWVEEIFCFAIVGWTEVNELYSTKKFVYQTAN